MDNEILLNEILNKVYFKIEPNQNIRKEYIYRLKKRFFKIFTKEKWFIDSNTQFKDIENSDLEVIKKLLLIDTMSRISVGFIINQICKNFSNKKTYLNIGVWRGFSMFAGMLNTKCEVHGVDNFSHNYEDADSSLNNYNESIKTKEYFYKHFNKFENKEKHFFYDIDYRKFFEVWENKNKKIDFYFYDGEHSYKNQYDNLTIAQNFFSKGTVILIDDFNETEVENATLDFVSRYDKKFRILKKLKTANRFIHPTYANGIVLIEKIS